LPFSAFLLPAESVTHASLFTGLYGHHLLEKIVLDLILDRFHFLCSVFQLDPPPANEPYQQALATIRSFTQPACPERIGWCWLYYRYVRSELALSSELFSELCNLDPRTLRRYQAHAIWRLTTLLTEAELQAIQQSHRERRNGKEIGNSNRPGMVVESIPFIVILDIWEMARYPT
jgi:hypothetical protein